MPPKDQDYFEIAHIRATEKKTHVSFPQLKYPSRRDEGLRDPWQWLQGKALDDGAEGLWRVHDSIYDLTTYIKKHPGGTEWLELTKGLDVTEAFEAHHLSDNPSKILEKYYVKKAETPRNSPFTFKEDGFYKTLKRAVIEELKKVPKSVSSRSDRIVDGLLLSILTMSAAACWFQNTWLVLFFGFIAGLSITFMTVASHNYIHRRPNWRMYLFNISMWSYRDFRVSHALSHHLYPNTLMDLEVSAFEPLIWWNPRKDKPFAEFTLVIEALLYPFSFQLNFLKRFLRNFISEGFFKNHYKWHDGIPLLLPVWMWLVTGTTFTHALLTWMWIISIASTVFFWIGSTAAHHHPQIFKDGDEVRTVTPDWGMHELEAVMDRKDINSNPFTVMIFFGDHSLHHLFPTLDHAVLCYLYPVFLEHCKKFKANFRMTTFFDLVIGHCQSAVKRMPNVLVDKLDKEN